MRSVNSQMVSTRRPKLQEEKRPNVHTFEAVAREWLEKQEKRLSAATLVRWSQPARDVVFPPPLGAKPIGKTSTAELLACLRTTAGRGDQ